MTQIAINTTPIDGVLIIEPQRLGDHRGWFSETFRAQALTPWGVERPFIQDNHAFTLGRGVVRGLHFQHPPQAQAKLVRVIRGAIVDIVVDLRKTSPSFGRHVAVELSESTGRQLYVPRGFAHGYVTLTEQTEVLYKVDAYYAPELEGGLAWNDEKLAIAWPSPLTIKTNDRDGRWPRLDEIDTPF